MANGKVCPACGKDIGVWAIVAAGLPSRIRCPHCRTLLRYDGTYALMALPFAIVMLSALIVHEVSVGIARPGLIVVIQVLLTWVPVEIPAGSVLAGPPQTSPGEASTGFSYRGVTRFLLDELSHCHRPTGLR